MPGLHTPARISPLPRSHMHLPACYFTCLAVLLLCHSHHFYTTFPTLPCQATHLTALPFYTCTDYPTSSPSALPPPSPFTLLHYRLPPPALLASSFPHNTSTPHTAFYYPTLALLLLPLPAHLHTSATSLAVATHPTFPLRCLMIMDLGNEWMGTGQGEEDRGGACLVVFVHGCWLGVVFFLQGARHQALSSSKSFPLSTWADSGGHDSDSPCIVSLFSKFRLHVCSTLFPRLPLPPFI